MNAMPWRGLAADPNARYNASYAMQISTKPKIGHYDATSSDDVEVFYSALQKWKSETYFLSSPSEILSHPSIKVIVKLGSAALPLVLDEIKYRPSILVGVLEEICGEVPYSAHDSGNIRRICEAWIAWGERNGSLQD